MEDSLIQLLKDIGTRATHSKYKCRVMLDAHGIQVNMWTRDSNHFYADRNYFIEYERLATFTANEVAVMFKYLETYIDRRIATKREFEEQAQKSYNQAMEYERKTHGD